MATDIIETVNGYSIRPVEGAGGLKLFQLVEAKRAFPTLEMARIEANARKARRSA